MVAALTKLRWACRRGMLELDIILQSFLDQHYTTLLPHQQQAFVALLNCSDQDLFAYLVRHQAVKDASLVEIVDLIQQQSDGN